MATLVPGDVISQHPTVDQLKAGFPLKLPKRNCQVLQMDSGAYEGFPPLASDKTALVAFLKARGGSLVRRVSKSKQPACSACAPDRVGIGADEPMHMRQRAG